MGSNQLGSKKNSYSRWNREEIVVLQQSFDDE
jgi:hypothetical protein